MQLYLFAAFLLYVLVLFLDTVIKLYVAHLKLGQNLPLIGDKFEAFQHLSRL